MAEQNRRVTIRPLEKPGDLGWVVMAHGEMYAQEYGWDTSFEALVAEIVAGYAASRNPARETAWIADVDGQRAGCIFCVAAGHGPDAGATAKDDTAKLRLLLTMPTARGLGIGTTLVRTCMDFARQAGYARMVLWTNDVLVAARRIYLTHGFTLAGEAPHHSFGVDLVGQTYETDLTRPAPYRPAAC